MDLVVAARSAVLATGVSNDVVVEIKDGLIVGLVDFARLLDRMIGCSVDRLVGWRAVSI